MNFGKYTIIYGILMLIVFTILISSLVINNFFINRNIVESYGFLAVFLITIIFGTLSVREN